jgi:hypothetical protein
MHKVYVALGFHASRLEIALLRQSEAGERHLALRNISLNQGVVCAESGSLVGQTELRGIIRESIGTIVAGRSVDVIIGIPDNLCRTRQVHLGRNASHERQSAVFSESCSQMESVVDMFPGRTPGSLDGEAFVVSSSRQDIMRYVSAVDNRGWILRNLTPLMVARYNYLIARSPSATKGRVLLVYVCQSACDIALWSGEVLLYREHLIRHDIRDTWESVCDKRVQQVAARIEGEFAVVVHAPREFVMLLDERSTARQTSGEDVGVECPVVDTVEGEVESLSLGYFDATLGLLAQRMRYQGGVCG